MSPEEKLAKIAAAFNTESKSPNGGTTMTHAYYNLEGAIIDMERTGLCDATSLATVKRVRDQLGEIGRILEARMG